LCAIEGDRSAKKEKRIKKKGKTSEMRGRSRAPALLQSRNWGDKDIQGGLAIAGAGRQ